MTCGNSMCLLKGSFVFALWIREIIKSCVIRDISFAFEELQFICEWLKMPVSGVRDSAIDGTVQS